MISLLWSILSAILLGFAQVCYMPILFGDVGAYQQYLGLLGFIGYVPLFLLLDLKPLKKVWAWSFLSLSLQYTIILYWLYIPLNVYGHLPPLIASLITLLLPLLLALKISVFLTIGHFIKDRYGISFFIMAPIALCAGEYFRNFYIFGGFPWGNVAYGVTRIDELLQVASIFGTYGIVFFVAVINALIALSIKTKRIIYILIAISLFSIWFIYGYIRLNHSYDIAPSLRIGLLQGNIEQEMKSHARHYASEIIAIYQDLFEVVIKEGAEIVIWPESAYPRIVHENIKSLPIDFMAQAANVIGAVAYGEDVNSGDDYVRNAAFILDHEGKVIKRYDKSHLVPFGEYVPWPLSKVVAKIVPGLGAFLPGTHYDTISLPLSPTKTVKLGVTICYEGIFPEISRSYSQKNAELLVNITNDAWYGYSSAPYQHLAMYRLRAVETGLSFLRATNSGISASIDPYGRLRKILGLFERGWIIDDIRLIAKPTLYSRWGDIIPIICLVILLLCYIISLIPIHKFIKAKNIKNIAIVILFIFIPLIAHTYFTQERFITDESARTKIFLIFLASLLFMIGFLQRTKRTKIMLLMIGILTLVVSLALVYVDSYGFLWGALIGVLLSLLGFSIRIL